MKRNKKRPMACVENGRKEQERKSGSSAEMERTTRSQRKERKGKFETEDNSRGRIKGSKKGRKSGKGEMEGTFNAKRNST